MVNVKSKLHIGISFNLGDMRRDMYHVTYFTPRDIVQSKLDRILNTMFRRFYDTVMEPK